MNNISTDKYETLHGQAVSMDFYGHASFRLTYKGKYLYIDPVGEYADYKLLPKADVILITHEHYDHLDIKSVTDLVKQDTVIIANKNSIEEIKKTLPQVKTIVLGLHDEVTEYDYNIKAFAAYNTTEGRDKFHPKDRDNGYLITVDNIRIYVSGDTEFIEDDEQINNCDILFLAVNQPYTMTIEQAVYWAKKIHPKVFYPYHTTDTDLQSLQMALKDCGFEVKIRQMQ